MPGNRRLRCTGIGAGTVTSTKCADINVRLQTLEGEFVEVKTQIHIIPELKCDMILGVSTLKPNNMTLSWSPDLLHFGNHTVPVTTSSETIPKTKNEFLPSPIWTTKSSIVPLIQRRTKKNVRHFSVYADKTVILKPGEGRNVPIRHRPLPTRKDYLFEPIPQADIATGQLVTAIQAVISDNQGAIPVSNFGLGPAKIRKGQILGRVSTLSHNAKPTTINFAFADVFTGKAHVEPDMPFIVQYPDDSTTSKADISDHWGPDYQSRVQEILDRHHLLFRNELGKFNDNIEMPIPFRDETDVTGLKQNPYPLTARDKRAMDEILDPLLEQGRIQKVPLGIPSAAASPAFVVWKNGKPRVVVDLKKVNTRLYPDAYPLPRQDTILGALGGSIIFSSVDLTKSFFQQGTKSSDWWKTTFVTPHRGQEWLTVSTMGLANTPGFFQHRMESLLAPYLWQFVLVYIDDIIIYSSSLDQHIQHLDQVLALLEDSGVTLSLNKCHFAYPSIQALGHHVSRLGLSTTEEKVEAIRQMKFPATLRDLEVGLGFFGYYRSFVDHFASIARPLVRLKTRGFTGAPIKGRRRKNHSSRTCLRQRGQSRSRSTSPSLPGTGNTSLPAEPDCVKAWEELKEKLCTAPTLAYPDFSKPFILYVDGSKEKGYGAALHQVGADGVERPVLYISRDLSDAETRYWATELEAGALVWALTKLPQYFDDGNFTVVTDHTALKSALQTKTKGRRSARLDEWSMFLSKYLPRMNIMHRPGKTHQNADGLSRLPTSSNDAYPVVLLNADDEFRSTIRESLPSDPHFGKLYKKIQDQVDETRNSETGPKTVYQSYRLDLDSGLLYFVNKPEPDRICIPANLQLQLFQFAHDNHAHGGINRSLNRIRRSAYIPKLKKHLQTYIDGCPACQLSKPSRQLPYGQLHPIETHKEPLAELSMDFIVGLPVTPEGFNCLATVTDRFSKYIRLIPGKETWGAKEWADEYYHQIFRYWGLPARIITDRDPRFTSNFWTCLFEKSGVKLGLTTAYKPSSNGQDERTNQTVETAIRCLLVGKYEENWARLVSEVEYALNTAENASTSVTPFELLYGVKPREMLEPLTVSSKEDDNAVDFLNQRNQLRNEVYDCIKLAQAKMALRFDEKHRPPDLTGSVYLKLAKPGHPGYHVPQASSLSSKKVGPFRIVQKVSSLAYKLELPETMRIHDVVSIVHLEQATPDPYGRVIPPPPPLVMEGEDLYVVEKIIRRETRGRETGYVIKWKGYPEHTWQSRKILVEDIPDMLAKFEKSRRR